MWRICISKILAVFLPGHKKTQASCVHGDFLVITTMAMVPYMRPAGGQCRKKGLTLLELLVAMVIISVVLAVAVPVAMSGRYAENGFNNLQRQLRGELAILRNEAIGRGTTTRMQLTANGNDYIVTGWYSNHPVSSCNSSGSWAQMRQSRLSGHSRYHISGEAMDNICFYRDGTSSGGNFAVEPVKDGDELKSAFITVTTATGYQDVVVQ